MRTGSYPPDLNEYEKIFSFYFLGNRTRTMAYSQSTYTDSLSDIAEQIKQTFNDGPKEQLDIRVRPATETKENREHGWCNYPMKTSPRGLAVIFNYDIIPNQERRVGSREDVKNLEELCKQLEFEVITYIDRTTQETLHKLDSIRKNPLMKTTDMLMVFIMSHGNKSSIRCSDGQLETETILKVLTCIELKGKPKFIAFQACRGEDEEVGISNKIMVDSSSAQYDSIWQDMYIVYSAIPGYVSYRTRRGSWFIQSLVRVFMNNAWNCHLRTLLRDVGIVMNCLSKDENKQMIEIVERGFTKNLYFNPGLSNLSLKNMEKNVNDPGMKKHNINPGLTFTDHEIERRIQTLGLSNADDMFEKGSLHCN